MNSQYSFDKITLRLGVSGKDSKMLSYKVSDLPSALRPAGVPLGTILFGITEGSKFHFTFSSHEQEYAVIPSIKGINPLTGLEATSDLTSHQRGSYCPQDPTHGVLKKGGYCPKCGMHWPEYNFVYVRGSTTLDSWRTGKDEYRAFIASKDSGCDVASFLSGGNPMSQVIGFALYQGAITSSTSIFSGWWYDQSRIRHLIQPSVYYGTTCRDQMDVLCCTNTSSTSLSADKASSFNSIVPDALAIGAGEAEEKKDQYKNGVSSASQMDINTFPEEPTEVVSILPVPYEYLKGIQDEIKGKVHGGPFKGIPVIK